MLTLSKTTLAGRLGADPDIRTMQSGDKVANLTVATSESWKDKDSGEWKERTEWHRVVLFNQQAIKFAEKHFVKGSQVYIEGQNETRKYEKDGRDSYTTEVVVRPFSGSVQLIDAFAKSAEDKPAQESSR